jgi:predicted ABC-type ATPase
VKIPRDARPLVVAIAGPNGAGKSTFFHSHLEDLGLPFVNADILAQRLHLGAYAAAEMAGALRRHLVQQRQSFVFETVFSDPVGDKVSFLKQAEESGFQVVLCFIGIASADISEARVSMRVLRGGHDVPTAKLKERHPRTLQNLKRAIETLPDVRVFDNDDLRHPYRLVALAEKGRVVSLREPAPSWLRISSSR